MRVDLIKALSLAGRGGAGQSPIDAGRGGAGQSPIDAGRGGAGQSPIDAGRVNHQ